MKLIVGKNGAGTPDGWIKPENVTEVEPEDLANILNILKGSSESVEEVFDKDTEDVLDEDSMPHVQLYNVINDPTEHHDVSK